MLFVFLSLFDRCKSNSLTLCYAAHSIRDNVRNVFIFLLNFVSAYFVLKRCSNIYERYYNSWIKQEEIIENETSKSETKSSMTEEKKPRQIEDGLMKLNVVEAPSVRSRILDECSWTNGNTNDSKRVDIDKRSSEDEVPTQKQFNNNTESTENIKTFKT